MGPTYPYIFIVNDIVFIVKKSLSVCYLVFNSNYSDIVKVQFYHALIFLRFPILRWSCECVSGRGGREESTHNNNQNRRIIAGDSSQLLETPKWAVKWKRISHKRRIPLQRNSRRSLGSLRNSTIKSEWKLDLNDFSEASASWGYYTTSWYAVTVKIICLKLPCL